MDKCLLSGTFVRQVWDFRDTRLGQGWDTFSGNLWYNGIVKKVTGTVLSLRQPLRAVGEAQIHI